MFACVPNVIVARGAVPGHQHFMASVFESLLFQSVHQCRRWSSITLGMSRVLSVSPCCASSQQGPSIHQHERVNQCAETDFQRNQDGKHPVYTRCQSPRRPTSDDAVDACQVRKRRHTSLEPTSSALLARIKGLTLPLSDARAARPRMLPAMPCSNSPLSAPTSVAPKLCR